MKPGANQPCPCGSGKKYKRCCRKLKRSIPKKATLYPDTDSNWPPLKRALPDRCISQKEFKRYLTPNHLVYITALSEALDTTDPEIAKAAMKGLDIIPREQIIRIPFLSSMRGHFLQCAESRQESLEWESEILLSIANEEHWLMSGRKLISWIVGLEEEKQKQKIDALRKTANRQPFPEPKLILARILDQLEINEEEQLQILSEILLPVRWKNQYPMAYLWLRHISHGFCSIITILHERNQPEKVARYAKMMLSYPWSAGFEEILEVHFKKLDLVLSTSNCFNEQVELSRILALKNVPWGWVYYNLGISLVLKNRAPLSVKYYKKMIDYGGHEQEVLPSIASLLIHYDERDYAKKLLELFEDKESREYINLSAVLKDLEKDYQKALELCNQGLELFPNDPNFTLYKAHFYSRLEEQEKSQEIYYSLLDCEVSSVRRKALIKLCDQLNNNDKSEESLKILQNFLSEEDNESEEDDEWQHMINLYLGNTMRQVKRNQEALEHLLIAKSFRKTWRLYFEIVATMMSLERYDEAETFLSEAESQFKPHNDLKHLRIRLNQGQERWEENLKLLDQIGLEWFRRNNTLRLGVTYRLAALISTDKPFEALEFCEEILDELLEHEELRELRAQAFKEAAARYRKNRDVLGTQESKLQQMKETRELLAKQITTNRNDYKDLKKSLSDQKLLEQELDQLRKKSQSSKTETPSVSETPKPFERLKQDHPQICKALPKHLMKILISAELLWNNLAAHTEQDHGPIVLQLARVVEGLVNKTLIDPLVKKALETGIEISALGKISGGLVRRNSNRLSLGECAHLLQGTKIMHNRAGIQHVELNPRSTDEHEKLLETLWNNSTFSEILPQTLSYLKNTLSGDLRKLAKIRNQAGHAGQIISRDKAKEIRTHVLGKNSLLGPLTSLEEIQVLKKKSK